MKQKKVPMRMCVACHQSKPKKELIRVVKVPQRIMEEKNIEKEVMIDLTGKMSGRGAYVCNDSKCFVVAKKNRKLDRALGITIDDAVYDDLISQMEESHDR